MGGLVNRIFRIFYQVVNLLYHVTNILLCTYRARVITCVDKHRDKRTPRHTRCRSLRT